MDLTYPAEAESFRPKIRAWLEENLPDGWFEPGFHQSETERKEFNRTWPEKLFAGGWICAGWPVEYGGKGLSLLEQVVLNEEFASAGAPMRADFFVTPWWVHDPPVGHRGAEEGVHPGILQGKIAWCQAFPNPTRAVTSRV